MCAISASSRLPHLSANPLPRLETLRLRMARSVWVAVVPLTLIAFVAALPARYAQLSAEADHYRFLLTSTRPGTLAPLLAFWVTSPLYPSVCLTIEIVVMLVCAVAAAILFWRRRDERMAILASLSLVSYGALFLPPLDALAAAHPEWALLVRAIQAVGLESSLLLFYVSPDGHFVPRWTRFLAVLWTIWTTASVVVPSAPFDFLRGRAHVVTPQSFPLPWLFVCLTWWSTGLLAQFVRYRRVSNPQQQQQTKWVLIGWTAVVSFYTVLVFPRVAFPALSASAQVDLIYRSIGVPGFEVILMLAPITITISMLRYRLWDVDLVINRALVYSLVTLVLGLVYEVSVMALEALFRAVSGQNSPLAIVLSTLASAALFKQVHKRIQRSVDRRFYRRTYDAARLIEEFGRGVRDDVELSALVDDLVAVVQQITQPAHISVLLLPVRTELDRAQQLETIALEPTLNSTAHKAFAHEAMAAVPG